MATADSIPEPTASERVLAWIEDHIQRNGLGPGDALPAEMEIMAACGTGRSSVREALSALKVLGIIRQRRKEGIRIIRDPVLLDLRHYFAERFDDEARYQETLEYRAALEWGFGPLIFAHIQTQTIQVLRSLLHDVEKQAIAISDLLTAEIRFHRLLSSDCGNQLFSHFAHLYTPLFYWQGNIPADDVAEEEGMISEWVDHHALLVSALEDRDEAAFLKALRTHTFCYMRLP
ncbi:MAG: FadR/GntR family transcriptional regulator [Planctomycetota bacterium]|jgi:DNA-binding FadR family transcriptional regulator